MTRVHGSPTLQVLISGYYGFDNAGDEAILEATVDGIRRHIPEADPVILSANPGRSAALTGARAVHRYRWREIRPFMQRGSLFVSGGGGLFQDATSRRSLFYYLGILLVARWRGMKTMIYAQGLGPLRRASSRAAVRALLSRVDRITFRDEASACLLKEIGVRSAAEVTADPVFTLQLAPTECAARILKAAGVPAGQPLIAVSLRQWPAFTQASQLAIAKILEACCQGNGAHLVFIPMHRPEDVTIAETMSHLAGIPAVVLREPITPAEIAAVLANCDALVAMRLHALILGSLSGLPSVALSYDPKVDAIARCLALEPAIDIQDPDFDRMAAILDSALNSSPETRARIQAAAAAQARRAERNYEIMAELVR